MFERFKSKSRFFVLVIISGLFVLAYVGGLFGARYMQRVIVDADTQAGNAAFEAQRVENVKKAMSETAVQQQRFDAYILPADGVVGFIEEIESLSRRAGIDAVIDGVQTSSFGPESPRWENLELVVSTEGPWTGTYTFLSLLENLEHKSNLSRVIIETIADADPKKGQLWRGEFSLRVVKKK